MSFTVWTSSATWDVVVRHVGFRRSMQRIAASGVILMYDVCPAATYISQPFGCTNVSGEWPAAWCFSGMFHAGIDLAAPGGLMGAPVYATRPGVIVANQDGIHQIFRCDGTVVNTPYLGPYAVMLQADEGVWIEYGHLSSAVVSPGQRVAVGDLLGYTGNEGASCGGHLHVEVRGDGPIQGVWQGAPIYNPAPFLMGVNQVTEDDLTALFMLAYLGVAGINAYWVNPDGSYAAPFGANPPPGAITAAQYWARVAVSQGVSHAMGLFFADVSKTIADRVGALEAHPPAGLQPHTHSLGGTTGPVS